MTVRADERSDGVEALRAWLLDVPELRGRIHREEPATPPPGAMGAATDMLVALLEPGGVAAVFAGATVAWVQSRRSNHTLTVTRADGSAITISTRQTRNLSPQELAELAERLARPAQDGTADAEDPAGEAMSGRTDRNGPPENRTGGRGSSGRAGTQENGTNGRDRTGADGSGEDPVP
ncbi:hypothetical protein [Streptomyces sp. V1I6]|uniref:effector-associated constant component EACC1 n=1 Tax=Streptomyces sp. V1I6 TaxID=3042273 RepID=UPI0027D8AB2F|nr:hypothetical protein [Streptomyces sp. V1I6]